MDAADVVRLVRADPGAYAEAFRVCTGTLWQKGLVTGLLKVDDMLIVNRGTPQLAPEALAGTGRDAAARACGEALRAMAVSRACREHGIGLHPPATMTGALLAAALDGVDWVEVGSKFLAATFARLSWQAAVGGGEAELKASDSGSIYAEPERVTVGKGK
jgi:hypothetical protein